MDTNKENILWNNFKEGQLNSFRPLFDYFYAPLCEYAYQILNDRMDAEDVVLDMFFFIWKNSNRINIGKSIRSYLFTAVKNRSLNHLRSVRSVPLDATSEIPVLDPALTDIDIKDVAASICAALETVSERSRLVWSMKREEGKSNKDIAQHLNISEKTVEADVTRIRKLINLIIKRNFLLTLFF